MRKKPQLGHLNYPCTVVNALFSPVVNILNNAVFITSLGRLFPSLAYFTARAYNL